MSGRWLTSAGASAPVDPTTSRSVGNSPLGLDIKWGKQEQIQTAQKRWVKVGKILVCKNKLQTSQLAHVTYLLFLQNKTDQHTGLLGALVVMLEQKLWRWKKQKEDSNDKY